jgi:hypothetical protein
VLDYDPGDEAVESLAVIEAMYGALPDTVQVLSGRVDEASGRRGVHFYFRHPGRDISNSVQTLARHLDVRGEGGLVVGPGSLHVTGRTYEWEAGPFAAGTDAGPLSPVPGSENAKLGVLHLTYLDALDFLAREATDGWWKKPLTVVWPGGADYFEPGAWTLHLTDASAWDVVLHELGHAVMDGAMDARTSGGSHKIDECYSAGLAWSEGWATFFAGAVRLSPDDPDAKFEFLVPRRAPIRLENVPADVCRGPHNEWRVAAGLWDIYDRHPDEGDAAVLPFRTLWTGVTGGVTRSVGDAWTLTASRLDPLARRAGEDAMIANSLLSPRSSGLTVSVDAALRGMMLRDAASLQSPRGR